jgi:hypothetical protein
LGGQWSLSINDGKFFRHHCWVKWWMWGGWGWVLHRRYPTTIVSTFLKGQSSGRFKHCITSKRKLKGLKSSNISIMNYTKQRILLYNRWVLHRRYPTTILSTFLKDQSSGRFKHCITWGCESSNHYHDFVPAKELFRWLIRSTFTNDRKRITYKAHNLITVKRFTRNVKKG